MDPLTSAMAFVELQAMGAVVRFAPQWFEKQLVALGHEAAQSILVPQGRLLFLMDARRRTGRVSAPFVWGGPR